MIRAKGIFGNMAHDASGENPPKTHNESANFGENRGKPTCAKGFLVGPKGFYGGKYAVTEAPRVLTKERAEVRDSETGRDEGKRLKSMEFHE